MPIIDAHHHLWDLETNRYPWLQQPAPAPDDVFTGDIRPIRNSYLLADFKADIGDLPVVKSVHLQADHDDADPVNETRWLQAVADAPGSGGFPHAIVAYADLADPQVDAVLAAHAGFANTRGIRQILNTHPQAKYSHAAREYMDDPQWERGYARLAAHGLSFDLQLYPHQMARAAAILVRHPDVPAIVNHTGTPIERSEAGRAAWRQELGRLAALPHVAIKISGLGMHDHRWTEASIRPFVLETIEMFGVARCLFASNFPVDKLYSGYAAIWQAFDAITAGFSADERRALFHDNAARLYRI
ncbi:MAG: amidohydrolase family protein [Alphaproteobacteria bacterium]